MNEVKSKRVMAAVAAVSIALSCVGCVDTTGHGNIPDALNNAPRPLVLIAKNDKGVLIKDGEGALYGYRESFYFSQTIMKSNIEEGQVIVGN